MTDVAFPTDRHRELAYIFHYSVVSRVEKHFDHVLVFLNGLDFTLRTLHTAFAQNVAACQLFGGLKKRYNASVRHFFFKKNGYI